MQKRLALAAMVGVAACTAFLLQHGLQPPARAFDAAEPATRMHTAPAAYRAAADAADVTSARARRVYPYSIVPGGVASRAELARAVMADKVVAAHYAGFAVEKASLRTVAGARAVYVSYRKGGQVYWTAHKVTLADGESILSDGSSEIRARCGNRISETPQLPVEANGPDERELDTPLAPAGDAPRQTAFGRDAVAHGKALALASFADGAGLLAVGPAHTGAGQAGPASALDAGSKRPLLAGLERSASRVAGQTTGSSTAGSIAVGTATMHSDASETGGASSSGAPDGAAGANPGGATTGTTTGTTASTTASTTTSTTASTPTGANPGPGTGKPALPGPHPDPLSNTTTPGKPHDLPEPDSLWLIGVAGAALLLQRRLRLRRPR